MRETCPPPFRPNERSQRYKSKRTPSSFNLLFLCSSTLAPAPTEAASSSALPCPPTRPRTVSTASVGAGMERPSKMTGGHVSRTPPERKLWTRSVPTPGTSLARTRGASLRRGSATATTTVWTGQMNRLTAPLRPALNTSSSAPTASAFQRHSCATTRTTAETSQV